MEPLDCRIKLSIEGVTFYSELMTRDECVDLVKDGVHGGAAYGPYMIEAQRLTSAVPEVWTAF